MPIPNALPRAMLSCLSYRIIISPSNCCSILIVTTSLSCSLFHRYTPLLPDPETLGVLFPTPTPLVLLFALRPPGLFLFLSSLVILVELFIATPGLPINLVSSILASFNSSSLALSFASCARSLSATEVCFLGSYHPSLVKTAPRCNVPSSSEE